jgi:hypothetical protein
MVGTIFLITASERGFHLLGLETRSRREKEGEGRGTADGGWVVLYRMGDW